MSEESFERISPLVLEEVAHPLSLEDYFKASQAVCAGEVDVHIMYNAYTLPKSARRPRKHKYDVDSSRPYAESYKVAATLAEMPERLGAYILVSALATPNYCRPAQAHSRPRITTYQQFNASTFPGLWHLDTDGATRPVMTHATEGRREGSFSVNYDKNDFSSFTREPDQEDVVTRRLDSGTIVMMRHTASKNGRRAVAHSFKSVDIGAASSVFDVDSYELSDIKRRPQFSTRFYNKVDVASGGLFKQAYTNFYDLINR